MRDDNLNAANSDRCNVDNNANGTKNDSELEEYISDTLSVSDVSDHEGESKNRRWNAMSYKFLKNHKWNKYLTKMFVEAETTPRAWDR